LKVRFEQVELAVSRVKEGSDIIRASLDEIKLLQEAESCVRRSQETLDKIIESGAALENPAANLDAVLTDLHRLDESHRQEVQAISDIKVRLIPIRNSYIHSW
jgi:autophagy-related protein 11